MENRDKRLWLRVNRKEDEEIKLKAKQMGVSASYYIRTRIFKKSEASVINAVEHWYEYRERLRELIAINKNINQLARYANYLQSSGQYEPTVMEEMNGLLREFTRCQREVGELEKKVLKA